VFLEKGSETSGRFSDLEIMRSPSISLMRYRKIGWEVIVIAWSLVIMRGLLVALL
jgi:hypothetical protein